ARARGAGSSNGNGPDSAPDWAELLKGAPEGKRREVLCKLAGHYRHRGLPLAEVEEIVVGFAMRCTPPVPEAEARAIARDLAAQDTVRRPASDAPTPRAYTFTPALPASHFVSQFVAYCRECTDAPLEYFEAVALILLATATPGVRVALRQYPRGLSTAFYALLIGPSTRSRKTSAAGLGLDIVADAVPDPLLAHQASPEAFVEELAARGRGGSLSSMDEMGELLAKLHHAKYMAGLRGLLLSLYEGRPYRYKRTTKRTKAGPVRDELVITRPHLSVLGLTTPAIFEIVTPQDIASGFLARFAIVMPEGQPPRQPFSTTPVDVLTKRHDLVAWLTSLYIWAKPTERRVAFLDDALDRIDRFAATIETDEALADERARAMLQRLNALAVKLAMLAAVGRPGTVDHDVVDVTPADADAAVKIATRWRDYAIAFASKVGDNALEQRIDRALQAARVKGRCARRDIARAVHCSKKEMDEVEATLEDRGEILVESQAAKSGPPAKVWVVQS